MKKNVLLFFLILTFSSNSFSQLTTTYWPNKKKKTEGILKDSVKIGTWLSWYENGRLQDSGSYIPLQLENLRVYISETEMKIYELDTLGIKKEDLSNHKETKTGKWVFYDDEGRIIEQGEYLPMAFIAINFVTGLDNSEQYVYNSSEPIKIGNWKYYELGQLSAEQMHQFGIVFGIGSRIEYYENGKKKTEGFFDENHFKWKGLVKTWNENGKLVKESNYSDSGSLIEEKKY